MSRRNCGVAVAVRARTGAGRQGWKVIAQGAIVGAEVVTPLRDTVSLVDGDEGEWSLREHLREAGDAEAFGCDKEELEGAVEEVTAGLACVIAGEAGVNASSADAEGSELGGLVVHECDERGNDERGALLIQRTAGNRGSCLLRWA